MGKSVCYVCKKIEGWGELSYTLKDYWRSPHTPERMTKNND